MCVRASMRGDLMVDRHGLGSSDALQVLHLRSCFRSAEAARWARLPAFRRGIREVGAVLGSKCWMDVS